MSKSLDKIKNIGVAKMFFAIVLTVLMVLVIVPLITKVCFMQHNVDGDYEFFWRVNGDIKYFSGTGGGLGLIASNPWAAVVALICKVTKLHPLFFCRTVYPFIFVPLMIIEYLYLGYRLFKVEERDNYFTYISTICFVTVYIFVLYFLAYNPIAPEGGVYLNSWRENVITGVILVPLPICTVLRRMRSEKKRVRDIVLLVFESLMILSGYSIVAVSRILVNGIDELGVIIRENIQFSWFIVMVIGFLLFVLGLKMKAALPLLVICSAVLVMLCPLSVGIIIAYGFTALITHEDGNAIWKMIAIFIFGLIVYVIGRVDTGWVEYKTDFIKPVNKYRITEGIPELCDYLCAQESTPAVIMDAGWASDVEMYAPDIEILSLEGVDNVNFTETVQESGREWDYVCQYKQMSVGEITLYENGFIVDTMLGDAIIFKHE